MKGQWNNIYGDCNQIKKFSEEILWSHHNQSEAYELVAVRLEVKLDYHQRSRLVFTRLCLIRVSIPLVSRVRKVNFTRFKHQSSKVLSKSLKYLITHQKWCCCFRGDKLHACELCAWKLQSGAHLKQRLIKKFIAIWDGQPRAAKSLLRSQFKILNMKIDQDLKWKTRSGASWSAFEPVVLSYLNRIHGSSLHRRTSEFNSHTACMFHWLTKCDCRKKSNRRHRNFILHNSHLKEMKIFWTRHRTKAISHK